MENFKNIITLLNNPETMELGATLAVSQGLGEKIVSLYKLKRSRQNYKKRDFFLSSKKSLTNEKFGLPKINHKMYKQYKFSRIRNMYSDIIFHVNGVLFYNSLNT